MSGTVKTQSALYAEFADGQAAGSITPGDVRDVIASIGAIAGTVNQVPIYQNGTVTSAVTINPANGHIQAVTLGASNPCTISLGNGNETANTRIKMELYVTQNASGTATVGWGSGISWSGGTPQVSAVANAVTLFNIISIDGGTTWVII